MPSPRCPQEAANGSTAPAAFFDVDGTIVSTHIVHQYVHVRKVLAQEKGKRAGAILHGIWLPFFVTRCLQYLYLDRVSRTRMNIVFYRNYRGLSSEAVRLAAGDCFERLLKQHLFADARTTVRDHLCAGRRVVLVTGSIDFLIAPLAEHLAEGGGRVDVLARSLTEQDGVFTGDLDGPPIGEEQKAEVVRQYARDHGVDLSASYAYGDSIADLPMLEIVGHPNTVNADRALAKHALQHGWPCHRWAMRNGS